MVKHSSKQYRVRQSRYDETLAVLKDCRTRTTNEILKELKSKGVNITFQGISKHLKLMIENKEVAFIDNTKNNKELITKIYKKNYYKKVKGYYIYTPLSSTLYKRLNAFVKNFEQQEKYQKYINQIVDIYRVLEIFQHYQEYEYTDSNAVRRSLRANNRVKHRLTRKFIRDKINAKKELVEKFVAEAQKGDISFKGVIINNQKYIYIGDEFVPMQKFIRFLSLLEMTLYMEYIAFKDEKNSTEHVMPLIQSMKDLFLQIVFDRQLRV